MPMITQRLMPIFLIPTALDMASGKLERHTAAMNDRLTVEAWIKLAPITNASGIPSSTVPKKIAMGAKACALASVWTSPAVGATCAGLTYLRA